MGRGARVASVPAIRSLGIGGVEQQMAIVEGLRHCQTRKLFPPVNLSRYVKVKAERLFGFVITGFKNAPPILHA